MDHPILLLVKEDKYPGEQTQKKKQKNVLRTKKEKNNEGFRK